MSTEGKFNIKNIVLTIRMKLIMIISSIVILTSGIMIVLALLTFKGDNEVRIQESNLGLTKMVARMVRGEFQTLLRDIQGMVSVIEGEANVPDPAGFVSRFFFSKTSTILYLGIAEKNNETIVLKNELFNDQLINNLNIKPDIIKAAQAASNAYFLRAFNGDDNILNASTHFNKPVVCLVTPIMKDGTGYRKILISYIYISRLLDAFRTRDDITQLFIVNGEGDILAHSNVNIVISGGNYINLPIVMMMKKSPVDNGNYLYENEKGVNYIGAFTKIGFSGMGVIATAEEGKVYRAVYKLQNMYIYITIIILAIVTMVVYYFSRVITEPINEVVATVKGIENGNFKVPIVPKTNDELGILARSIIQMGKGLEERERMRKDNEELIRESYAVTLRNEHLQELDRIKNNFFANISHEIRTPLTMILSPIESVLQGDYKKDVDDDFLKGIQRNTIRLLKLVNNLLDFAKIEEGQMILHITQRDIVEVIENYTESVAQTAETRGIGITFSSPSEGINLFIDIEKIDRVLMNLISNALKFTDPGGKINITASEDANFCHITISDTGIGIPGDKIASIFDRFVQADQGSTRKYEGTGIGLALAREFTTMHSGTISVSSRHIDIHPEDHGTIFTVSLPKGKGYLDGKDYDEFSDEASGKASRPGRRYVGMREMAEMGSLESGKNGAQMNVPAKQTGSGPAKHKVLVVEDNSDLRNFLMTLLGQYFAVYQAVDGKDGLLKFQELEPDLVVTDVMMPNMNGYDLTREIKKGRFKVPVIMLSAKTDMEHKIEGLEFGADDYVGKPFSSHELIARINNLLKTYEYEKIILKRNQDIEEDLETAKLLQRKLLPENIPDLPGYGFHATFIPMDKVGGDFYDFVSDDNCIEVFISDVSGHGISGAFLATIAKMALKGIKNNREPRNIILTINSVIYENTVSGNFITAFFGVIDKKTNVLRFTNAGHVPPFIYRKSSDLFIDLQSAGMPLGWIDELNLKESEVRLEKDDRIIFYTDGVIECRDTHGTMVWFEGLKDFIKKNRDLDPGAFSDALLDHLHVISGRNTFEDDVCYLVIDIM